MIALPFAWRSIRDDQRLCWLVIGALLCASLVQAMPHVVPERLVPFGDVSRPQATAARDAIQPADPPAPTLPPALAPVLNATLAANASTDYTVAPLGTSDDTLRATNAAQGFTTTFAADGVHIAPAHGPDWTLRAAEIRTAASALPLTPARPTGNGPRVEYQRDGLTEWYVNGPRGLEQGFTLAKAPSDAEQFTIALAMSDTVPMAMESGALLIGDLRYGDLAVIDAAGKTLPAHLETAAGQVSITVDARGAAWPVTVDPTLSQATLTPQTPPGNSTFEFGFSVALATENGTTTVVIGAPGEEVNGNQSEQGAVYVFTGSGTTYTQRARLAASDGAAQNRFGNAVAVVMSGGTTTIVAGAPNRSAVYVFTGSGEAYTERAKLVAPDPTNNDSFGGSVAAAVNGGTTVIAVGSFIHSVPGASGLGSVYMFEGSGSSYPLQVELNDPTAQTVEDFGVSIALARNGGTNTLAVGARNKGAAANVYSGAVVVFTGSGTNYSAVTLYPADGQTNDAFGSSVAVGIQGGITTVVAGAPSTANFGAKGAAYVFTGTGTSYTQTKLTDATSSGDDHFGRSVAVGYGSPIGPTLVAVGASSKNSDTANPADGVSLFSCARGACIQSALPRSGGVAGDDYGWSMAMLTAANGDMTLVAGTFDTLGSPGAATIYYGNEAPTLSSITPLFGDRSQTIASPNGTFSGAPFHLLAGLVNSVGAPVGNTGVTFTINPSGGASGVFNASDPNSTTLHTTTDGAGHTPTINLYPSSTAGTFTVTATADGTTFATRYTLTILPNAPKPTINPVLTAQVHPTAARAAAHSQPAGLSPAMVIIDPNVTYTVHVNGTGFLAKPGATAALIQIPGRNATRIDVLYVSATELNVYLVGAFGVFDGLTHDTTAQIYILNEESSPGAGDGGFSNPAPIQLVTRRPATADSTLQTNGNTTILVPPDAPVVPAPVLVRDALGNPAGAPLTSKVKGVVGAEGGESGGSIIGNDGASVLSDNGLGIISNDGGGIITDNGGGIISNDGGSLISDHGVGFTGSLPASARKASAPPKRADTPLTGDYYASTDRNGVVMAPPVWSDGIPGTFTRTLTVDGIDQQITYTFVNLNPNDGHPASITTLSRTSAFSDESSFTLTVTGTGFVGGSVLSYGGVQLATTVDSATQLHATIPATLLRYAGSVAVTVINPDPYGGTSLPVAFTVTERQTPLPEPKPSAPSGGGPNPLPAPRAVGPATGPAPNPLPPSR